MSNIAIILAGGVGARLGDSKPKQLLKIAGKTVIEHTIDIFEKSKLIDEIAVVVHCDIKRDIERSILQNKWTKVKKILIGGKERYDSSLSAIRAYEKYPDYTNLIFHDAVRPLLNPKIIESVINKLKTYNVVDVIIPSSDTIVQVNETTEKIMNVPSKLTYFRSQTPQGFKLWVIKKAYDLAEKKPNFKAIDDCDVISKMLPDIEIGIVYGEEKNIKLTYPEDAYLLDKLFQIQSVNIKTDINLSKLNGKHMVVFGGNSGIGAEIIKIAEANGAKCRAVSRSLTHVDISKHAEVHGILKKIANEWGGIDYVVNSAAILKKEPLMSMDQAVIRTLIETNYYGVVNVAIESYPYLKESKGKLLFFTSSSYTRGRAFYSLYSSTKAAVVNFVQALAEEWDRDNIKINCINPERTNTPMRTTNFGLEDPKTLLNASDVAKIAMVTLLSDITGQVVDVKVKDFI